jgi:hypothetical protein
VKKLGMIVYKTKPVATIRRKYKSLQSTKKLPVAKRAENGFDIFVEKVENAKKCSHS